MPSAQAIRRKLKPGELDRLAHTARGGPGISDVAQEGAIVALSLLSSSASVVPSRSSDPTPARTTLPKVRRVTAAEASRLAAQADADLEAFEASLWGHDPSVAHAQAARRDERTLAATLGAQAVEDAELVALLPETAPAIRAQQAAALRRRDPAAADRARLLDRLERPQAEAGLR